MIFLLFRCLFVLFVVLRSRVCRLLGLCWFFVSFDCLDLVSLFSFVCKLFIIWCVCFWLICGIERGRWVRLKIWGWLLMVISFLMLVVSIFGLRCILLLKSVVVKWVRVSCIILLFMEIIWLECMDSWFVKLLYIWVIEVVNVLMWWGENSGVVSLWMCF